MRRVKRRLSVSCKPPPSTDSYKHRVKSEFLSGRGFVYWKENLLEIIKNENTVIAPGGGTPCYFDNMDIMNNAGFTVYIRQGTNCLHQRLNRSKKFRPLIENMEHFELVEYLETTMEIRAPFYRQAKITVAGKGLSTKKLERVIQKHIKIISA